LVVIHDEEGGNGHDHGSKEDHDLGEDVVWIFVFYMFEFVMGITERGKILFAFQIQTGKLL